MLIVYRKEDGLVVSNSGTNSYLPEGPPFEAEVVNAISVYGGEPSDYEGYRLHDEHEKEQVEAILRAGSYELVFNEEGEPVGVKTYPRVEVEANPQQVNTNQEVTVTVTIPGDSQDSEVRFFIGDSSEPIAVEPINDGEASHTLMFTDPGVYSVSVESDTHGRAWIEVVVQNESTNS